MGLLELLKKIEDAYILNAPNIETMREFAYTAGYDVEYRYGFCRRWWNWICFYDCEYVLTHNDKYMRNYTS